jgi:hypothetical protein
MDALLEDPLMCPTVHLQYTAVLHDILFRVPAPTTASISTHIDVSLPEIFLND